jgi:hypothetical protein
MAFGAYVGAASRLGLSSPTTLRLQTSSSAASSRAPVFLDTPEANPAALALAKRHGMMPVFETARMYTKEPPTAPVDRCYGVTTFELG